MNNPALSTKVSRRTVLRFLCFSSLCFAGSHLPAAMSRRSKTVEPRLKPARYDQVAMDEPLALSQKEHSIAVLLSLSDDSLLKPFRLRAGLPAPGEDLGGWYDYFEGYDWQNGVERGFAPGHCFGQWLSALARAHATDGGAQTKAKVFSLVKGLNEAISPLFFKGARFPGYTYDKLVIGLIDAHRYAHCDLALPTLEKTTEAVLPYLPDRAEDRETPKPGLDASFTWDEPYTLPENLFIAYSEGAGERYLPLAKRFLLDKTYFGPLAKKQDALTGKHAYSYVNALGSGMRAYIATGDKMYLDACSNAFDMIVRDHSFATGGWGPDEHFQKPGTGALALSLQKSHESFETPCGAYAHLKLTNYLTCVSGDSRFGDSAEAVIYNTVLGAKPLEADGRAFYYADYNNAGRKVYSSHRWPCCAGTLPQVATDYGRHAYFFAADDCGVYVNLYFSSSLNWQQHGRNIKLIQRSEYPQSGKISIKIEAEEPAEFVLNLRIPAWTQGEKVELRLDGQLIASSSAADRTAHVGEIRSGTFFALTRTWTNGTKLELSIPQPLRLVSVDRQNPDLVALMCGPRVFFALADAMPAHNKHLQCDERAGGLTRTQMLLAKRKWPFSDDWFVTTSDGKEMRFVPYTALADQPYRTYMQVV